FGIKGSSHHTLPQGFLVALKVAWNLRTKIPFEVAPLPKTCKMRTGQDCGIMVPF
ncbi:hypothetical protein LCGC14_2511620, partial [marine sediment metagenome]